MMSQGESDDSPIRGIRPRARRGGEDEGFDAARAKMHRAPSGGGRMRASP